MGMNQQVPRIADPRTTGNVLSNRWVQLTAGILGMIAVANFQYAWTLFVGPLMREHGWSRVAVLDALAIYFILAQTWLVPFEGYMAEHFGPRRLLVAGGFLAALAWVINAYAPSLLVLNAAQVLSGCASGIVYSISMGSALKWFPDRRGLAAGLTAAAFGAGSAATILPIEHTIENSGYQSAFLWFGIGQGVLIVLVGLVLRFPRADELLTVEQKKSVSEGRDYTPREMLRMPTFWLIYMMMTMGAVPGLLMIGQLKPMAKDFGLINDADKEVFFFGTIGAVSLALMIDRIMGGLTRPVFGWISDHIGRERAIFVAFTVEGFSLLLLYQYSHNPVMFVVTSGMAFFGWGAVFSLFPALSGDLFGRKFATTNYAWLYTAKGAAALLVAGCNRLQADTGSWMLVFVLMIAFDWLAALLALFALKPLRARLARQEQP